MSAAGMVEIVEETGEPIAKITVNIIEIPEGHERLTPGFYFAFPRAGVPSTEVVLHGPEETHEDALDAAGSFLIHSAEAEASERNQDIAA
ncbi:hypothetical protein [Methylorubrum extorquens]|uniref:hypothetical protein n=1 Tax=Methylorubrum extorquens TaxID=408 RepID=UPI0020A1AE6F|nr:hypothetical protein [Methylorubrum extorquens]MCP1539986.1 hypothetical protein [Methylorubrum extorquens]